MQQLSLFFDFLKAINKSIFLDSVICISNRTEKEDGYVCYHASYIVSLAIHHKTTAYCGTVGRYVIYQHILAFSAEAQIALCEVEVSYKCWHKNTVSLHFQF